MSPLTIYERVPDELKLMIWEEAIPSSGVHYFKVEVPKLGTTDQRLKIQSMGLASDTSTWIERCNLFWADGIANEVVRRWVRKTKEEEGALWIAPLQRKKGKNNQQRVISMVLAKNDIVCLQFAGVYDFDIAFIDNARTKRRFQGLQKIAINFRAPDSGRGWIIRPFQCLCNGRRHAKRGFQHCPAALSQFLSLFPSMNCFYLIYRINGKQIKSAPAAQARTGQKRTRESQVVKKSADQVINETLAKFRDIAKRDKLEIIMDMKRTYYEVRQRDSQMLVDQHELWHTIRLLKHHICGPRDIDGSASTTHFKVLVCRDRLKKDD